MLLHGFDTIARRTNDYQKQPAPAYSQGNWLVRAGDVKKAVPQGVRRAADAAPIQSRIAIASTSSSSSGRASDDTPIIVLAGSASASRNGARFVR